MIDGPRQTSTIPGGTLNLMNAVVGAGILSLPFAFKLCGTLVGVCFVIIFGLFARHSAVLLLEASALKSIRSYEGLAEAAMGRAGFYAYNTIALLNGLGTLSGYVIIIGDTITILIYIRGVALLYLSRIHSRGGIVTICIVRHIYHGPR